MTLGEIGPAANRGLKFLPSGGVVIHLPKHATQIVVGLSVSGIRGNRAAECSGSLLQLSAVPQFKTTIIFARGVCGRVLLPCNFAGLLKFLFRTLAVTRIRQRGGQRIRRVERLRIAGDRSIQDRHSFSLPMLADQSFATAFLRWPNF